MVGITNYLLAELEKEKVLIKNNAAAQALLFEVNCSVDILCVKEISGAGSTSHRIFPNLGLMERS